MTYRHLVLDLDRSRHIATVTLNKPERLNAIDQNDKVDLLDAIARIQSDDDIWVAIWTGAGRGFCSGADLQGPPPDDGNKPLNELLDEESRSDCAACAACCASAAPTAASSRCFRNARCLRKAACRFCSRASSA